MASKYATSPTEDTANTRNTWNETRNFHPEDQLLRDNGFSIHSRPRNGRVMWVRDGKVVTHEVALSQCDQRDVRKIRGGDIEEELCRGKRLRGGTGR